MSSLEERVAIATAPAWRPAANEKLEKVAVVQLSIGHTDEYGDYPKLICQKDDDTYIAVHVFHQTLRERLIELAPAAGDLLNFMYLGERKTNAVNAKGEPTEYHLYYVERWTKDADKKAASPVADGFSWDLGVKKDA